MSFGHNIRLRREGLGITQAGLARKLGVSRQRVAYVEDNEQAAMSYRVLKEYADALDTSVDALANGGSDVAE